MLNNFKENVMVGLTHNEDGTPMIRVPRSLKVGIGIPRGKAIRVFIHPTEKENPWYVVEGYYEGRSLKERSHRFPDRASAEAAYGKLKDKVPECTYPRKLKFFTFSKPTVTEKGGEVYEPDFDAIEAGGPTPTRIPIIFTDPSPLRMNYQMWSATELRCKGDGINAMRSVLMGSDKDPGWKEAKESGERYFPIIDGCMQRGCAYGKRKDCKPGLTINFQPADYPVLGPTAAFHTTGWESCRRTFSSFTVIKNSVEKATGHDISGLCAFLTMRPYVTHPEGQKPATQFAIHVELPLKAQQSIMSQLRGLFDDGPRRQIAAPEAQQGSGGISDNIIDAEEDIDGEIDETPIGAAAMAAEFNAGMEEDGEADGKTPPPVATATAAKQADVSERLKKAKEAKAPVQDPLVAAPAPPPEPPAPSGPVPAAPWSGKAGMDAALGMQRDRVGVDAYAKVFADAGTNPSSLKHDSEKAARLHADLSALPSVPTDDDTF